MTLRMQLSLYCHCEAVVSPKQPNAGLTRLQGSPLRGTLRFSVLHKNGASGFALAMTTTISHCEAVVSPKQSHSMLRRLMGCV